MKASIKHRIWLVIATMSLSVGGFATTPINANAALKWHKGTPNILNGKRYRAKQYIKKLGPVARHFEWITGTKSTFAYNGFQWGMKAKSTTYKKSGKLYLLRGKDTLSKNYEYLKIKVVTSKKIYVRYGGESVKGTPWFSSELQTMTRF